MNARRLLSVAVGCSFLFQAVACTTNTDAPDEAPATTSAALIGGIPADVTRLDAIGAIGTVTDGKFSFFCTGTLISPTMVLTSKSCAIDGETVPLDTSRLYFAIGGDATAPRQVVELNGVWFSPVWSGGFQTDGPGLGNDVALYSLVRPVTDVKPLPFATETLRKEDLGTKFFTAGYGIRMDINYGVQAGQRWMGTNTLRALEGRYFEEIFGSPEAMLADVAAAWGPLAPSDETLIREIYEKNRLLPGYDAWAGHAEGDVQTCFGDTGGPLFRAVPVKQADGTTKSELRVFGVVSASWFSQNLVCDYGTWYAVLGPAVQRLLSWATTYEDPCAGTTIQGECNGMVATRCTIEGPEGTRRKTETDCGALALACGLDANGWATCFDPEAPREDLEPSGSQTTLRAPSLPSRRPFSVR